MNGEPPNDDDRVVRWGVASEIAGDRRRNPYRLLPADGSQRSGSVEAPSPSTDSDESSLVQRIMAGEPAALGIVYDRHAPHVYDLALAIVGESRLAERVVKETFFWLWSHPDQVNSTGGRLAEELLAKARAIGFASAQRTEPVADIDLATEKVLPLGERDDDDRPHTAIAQAISNLAPDQRRAIELAYFAGFDERAISRSLGLSVSRTRRLLRLGFAALRRQLADSSDIAASVDLKSRIALNESDPQKEIES